MLLAVDDRQASVPLGAAKAVATGGDHGTLSDAAAGAISSLAVLGLGIDPPDLDTLNPSSPAQLVAWDRGLHATADTFSRDFCSWDRVEDAMEEIRDKLGVPPLDPTHAASSRGAVAGVDYHPIA